ncbi:MAG: hypothetical protein ACLFWI_24380 [Coleofasciculus sp.]|uniref:hypothetical protein n=1 Tax=Coleofasciculus sp. TaxID=3100458 RepID=UPI003A2200DC
MNNPPSTLNNQPSTNWYSLTPAGPIAIGNLTPVGQNSGQVGCRWPPNGHQLAACLNLPRDCQLLGPFWYFDTNLYVPLPQPVYTLETKNDPPQQIYRLQWHQQRWRVQPDHQDQDIEIVGGKYLIPGNSLKAFWNAGKSTSPKLKHLPWQTLTLSHNHRDEEFQVKEEAGFFAEMTTLMDTKWSMLVKVIGDYTPPNWSILGAGGTPVAIAPVRSKCWDWLEADCPHSTGAVLLTGALWQKPPLKRSVPYPPTAIKAYAADRGIPWQSWKKVRAKATLGDSHQPQKRVQVLTPGEWLTPAGAVYLWDGVAPIQKSGPFPDPFQRHVLGYGHLWLF